MKIAKLPGLVFVSVLTIALLFAAVGIYRGGSAIKEVFWENAELKKAITNLTDDGRIGYAKVLTQILDPNGNVLFTTVKFVETDIKDKNKKLLEKEFIIQGDIVHFDALVVKFGDKMVMDGKKRSLYLWRRIYGETTAPAKGFLIEETGTEPYRYKSLLSELPLHKREQFWKQIWDLANDPNSLNQYDITAIYGNVTYTKLRPGLIYIFNLTPTGQVYPEVVPDI